MLKIPFISDKRDLKQLLNFQDIGKNGVLLLLITAIGMFLRFYDLGA